MIRVVKQNDKVSYVNDKMYATMIFDKHTRTFRAWDVDGHELVHFNEVAEVDYITEDIIYKDIYNVKSFVDVD